MFWAMGKLLKELVARGWDRTADADVFRAPTELRKWLNSMDVAEVQGLTSTILVSSFGVPKGSQLEPDYRLAGVV
jgi:hypothetical protein